MNHRTSGDLLDDPLPRDPAAGACRARAGDRARRMGDLSVVLDLSAESSDDDAQVRSSRARCSGRKDVNYPTLKLLGLSFQLQAKLCLTDDDRLVEAALDAITFAALKSAFSI